MAGGDRKAGRNKKKCEKYRNLRGDAGTKHPKGESRGTDTHLYAYDLATGRKTSRRPIVMAEPTSTIPEGPAHLSTAVMLTRHADKKEEAASLCNNLFPHLRDRIMDARPKPRRLGAKT